MATVLEIEKKYVIKMPRIEELRAISGFAESDIVQIYLNAPSGVTHRVRKRVTDGKAVYSETRKSRVDKMSSYETEDEITEQRFSELIENQRKGSTPILKKRISFPYGGYVFEIDIYPAWKRSCILEIELGKREEKPKIPDFLELVADVTGNGAYSNSAMSNSFPKELI